MTLTSQPFVFTLLTPCFSGTAYGKDGMVAAMRIPPIRGHVREWHRVLFGATSAHRSWGGTAGAEAATSKVGLRFADEIANQQTPEPKAMTLPHKAGDSTRASLKTDQHYRLVLQRLIGCTSDDWTAAQKAAKLWLFLGCVGLRANRAAGSVWPADLWAPQDETALHTELTSLGLTGWEVALIGQGKGKTPTDLREAASDTLNGHPEIFGDIPDKNRTGSKRIPSPLKLKVVRLGNHFCLLAAARRIAITTAAGPLSVLRQAESLLSPKPRWTALGAWNHLAIP